MRRLNRLAFSLLEVDKSATQVKVGLNHVQASTQTANLQCDYSNPVNWKKIIQSQRFFENRRFPIFVERNTKIQGSAIRPLKSLIFNRAGTYLSSQKAALKIFNVIGPFAKNLENLLFLKNVVIGQSSFRCPGSSTRTEILVANNV